MRRVVALVSVVAVVLAALLAAGRGLDATAQEATPPPEAGVTFELLGAGPSAEAPGRALVLSRVTLAAGFSDPRRHTHPFDYVLSVESGSLAFSIESGTLLLTRAGAATGAATPAAAEPVAPGEEVTVGPGDSFAGNAEVVWATERVVGDEPFVGVVTTLGPPGAPFASHLDGTPTP